MEGGGAMHTLHEFFTVTKGHEYLIAVTFFFLFISFWRFLTRGKD
jgi:hypothetical protein